MQIVLTIQISVQIYLHIGYFVENYWFSCFKFPNLHYIVSSIGSLHEFNPCDSSKLATNKGRSLSYLLTKSCFHFKHARRKSYPMILRHFSLPKCLSSVQNPCFNLIRFSGTLVVLSFILDKFFQVNIFWLGQCCRWW